MINAAFVYTMIGLIMLLVIGIYSGTPLLWTPWGPGEVSCIQWNPSIMDTLGA